MTTYGRSSSESNYDSENLEKFSNNCYARGNERSPIRRLAPKIKRNEKCPFDNTKKFKNCCGTKNINHCPRLLLDYIDSKNNAILPKD